MFLNRKVWQDIPQGLDIYFGDNFIFDLQLHQKKTNYLITNMYFESQFAATTSDKNITGGLVFSMVCAKVSLGNCAPSDTHLISK